MLRISRAIRKVRLFMQIFCFRCIKLVSFPVMITITAGLTIVSAFGTVPVYFYIINRR